MRTAATGFGGAAGTGVGDGVGIGFGFAGGAGVVHTPGAKRWAITGTEQPGPAGPFTALALEGFTPALISLAREVQANVILDVETSADGGRMVVKDAAIGEEGGLVVVVLLPDE